VIVHLKDPGVVGGADTHADTIHVAVISVHGADLADCEFPTTAAGYRDAICFLTSHGSIEGVGIEGTSSYGAGLARAVKAAGLKVIEVNRPDRAERRRLGKSDPIDAYQAAHAFLSGRAVTPPKDEAIEGFRALHNARHSAVKARTAAINQIHQMLITAPENLRTKYAALKGSSLISTLAGIRTVNSDAATSATLTSLKALAKRCQFLTQQHTDLGVLLDTLVTAANPGLRAAHGLGPDTTA
jgi:transposase